MDRSIKVRNAAPARSKKALYFNVGLKDRVRTAYLSTNLLNSLCSLHVNLKKTFVFTQRAERSTGRRDNFQFSSVFNN